MGAVALGPRQDRPAAYCDVTYLVKVDGEPVGTVSRGRFTTRTGRNGRGYGGTPTRWVAESLSLPHIGSRLKRDTRKDAVALLLDHIDRRT